MSRKESRNSKSEPVADTTHTGTITYSRVGSKFNKPQFVSVHEHDGNNEWDEETRLLVRKYGECAEPGDEGEHGKRVDVADAGLGPPLV